MNNYAAASGSADSMYVVLHTEINGIFIVWLLQPSSRHDRTAVEYCNQR